MAYSEFTLESADQLLGVVSRPADLFPNLMPAVAPTWLADTLARGGQGLQLSTISEKARSEFVVAPMLLAARELSGDRFAIFSGQRLDVDPARGLIGECDFILTTSTLGPPLRSPIAVVVEAKKNDIDIGLGQCVAQMVAADLFNQAAGRPRSPIFGCVTTGETWQFLKLDGQDVLIDRRRYFLIEKDLLLAILVDMTTQESQVA